MGGLGGGDPGDVPELETIFRRVFLPGGEWQMQMRFPTELEAGRRDERLFLLGGVLTPEPDCRNSGNLAFARLGKLPEHIFRAGGS
jgi:hypothetical protein